MSNDVNHPGHYNRGRIEVIRAIEEYAPDAHCGNALKYLCRAGHKPGSDLVTDLCKAEWYLCRAIERERLHWTRRAHFSQPTHQYLPPFSIAEFLDDQGLAGARRHAADLLMQAGERETGKRSRLPLLEAARHYVMEAQAEASQPAAAAAPR